MEASEETAAEAAEGSEAATQRKHRPRLKLPKHLWQRLLQRLRLKQTAEQAAADSAEDSAAEGRRYRLRKLKSRPLRPKKRPLWKMPHRLRSTAVEASSGSG